MSGSPCGIARGGTAAGKKPGHDGFGRPGAVHRSNAGAGDRPRDAQQRTSLCQLGSRDRAQRESSISGPLNALH